MIDLDALVERYVAVWNEPNPTVAMSVSRLSWQLLEDQRGRDTDPTRQARPPGSRPS
jgi:hypothetical protein